MTLPRAAANASDPVSAAVAAEHAAIFGYGVLGPHLDKAGKSAARKAEALHRDRRDAITLALAAEGTTPPAAEAAYALPFPVTDEASALRLAVILEEGTAQGWRTALGATSEELRGIALDALVQSAVTATKWRIASGQTPATVPFPGTPA